MKQNNQPVTEERLEEILEATEERLEEILEAKLEFKLEEKLGAFKDDIMSRIDYLIGRYEATEEDRILAAGQTRDLRNDIEDHERRITKLETKLGN